MPVPSVLEAQSALGPYHSMIRLIIEEAWAEWRDIQRFREKSGYGTILYPRTLSNYMFDAIARRAIPRLGADAKIKIINNAQTFKAFVNGLLVRIKKGGEDNLGCNWPTQTALAFEEADWQFPGLPPETGKVEIIWQPNDIWTQVEQILVVARDGDSLIWQYEVPPIDSAKIEVLAPKPTKSPDDGDAGDLVKPKVAKPKTDAKS